MSTAQDMNAHQERKKKAAESTPRPVCNFDLHPLAPQFSADFVPGQSGLRERDRCAIAH
jgi:hypothetical protein